ncbi:hypothetical protein [Spirosoma aerolatum]|uniref:hypothetical protein n=1 Tax=Spirosoma aerolatum TaxID=1211326 RepID=UPI0009AC7CFA|nr:hypothetical protein [Spirosoma aerolatum]
MEEILKLIKDISLVVAEPFYRKPDFLISTAFSGLGLWLTWLAYKEAERAKEAAEQAAKSVKSQAIAMELQELVQKHDKFEVNIRYTTCRDILAEYNRKIRRLISPYRNEQDLQTIIQQVEQMLDAIRAILDDVRPYSDETDGVSNAVYNAVEGPFAVLNGQIGELIGTFERRTVNPQ